MTSPLHGGRRRRRAGRRTAVVAGLLAPVALAVSLYFGVIQDSGGGAAGAPPVAARIQPGAGTPVAPPQPPPSARVSLAGVDAFRLRFARPPRAGLLFDVGSGEVLWRRQPVRRLPVASLTKIMTALIVVQHTRPRERVRITRDALRYSGSGVGVLPRGRRVPAEALLAGLLLVSGNDAAIALADHISRTQRRFVRLMNARARAIGLTCTRFVSPHGLEARNVSCARDLAVLTRLAMKEPRIARVARKRQASYRFPIKARRLFLYGHNPLIRAGYRGAIGLKTGYTQVAGRCFVGVARRGGRTLAVVLLRSANPAKHAARLLDLGFRRG